MKTTSKKSAQTRSEEISRYTEILKKGIKDVRTSDGYRKVLDTMSKFPRYSMNNIIMIYQQNPKATQVCGFNTWKKLGRYVKKGEQGIRIWAPMTRKVKDEDDNTESVKVFGYRLVSVFDVSQTDGTALATYSDLAPYLQGSFEDFDRIMTAVKSVAAFPVEYADLTDDIRGYSDPVRRIIKIRNGMSQVQQFSTLVHETAHSLMHGESCHKSSKQKELEAESISHIVCRHFGVDTSAKAFGYVAAWTEGMEDDEVMKQIDAIRSQAANIIDAIEKAIADAGETSAA